MIIDKKSHRLALKTRIRRRKDLSGTTKVIMSDMGERNVERKLRRRDRCAIIDLTNELSIPHERITIRQHAQRIDRNARRVTLEGFKVLERDALFDRNGIERTAPQF